MSKRKLKIENRNSELDTYCDFRVSTFEFRPLLARHLSLVTCHCSYAQSH
jgi:hypothetical protein